MISLTVIVFSACVNVRVGKLKSEMRINLAELISPRFTAIVP